jgi:hypothetical protein
MMGYFIVAWRVTGILEAVNRLKGPKTAKASTRGTPTTGCPSVRGTTLIKKGWKEYGRQRVISAASGKQGPS